MAETFTPLTTSNLANQTSITANIDANFSKVSSLFTDVVSRSGQSPNSMTATLDMNSQPIINLPAPVSNSSPLRLTDLESFLSPGQVIVNQTIINSQDYATIAAVQAAIVPNTVNCIRTIGYATAGDGGAASYVRTGGSTTGGIQSLDGQWWKIADVVLNILSFGAGLGGDDTTTINNAASLASVSGRDLLFPSGTYLHSGTLNFGYSHIRVRAVGQPILRHTGSGTGVAMDAGNTGFLFDIEFGRGNPIIIDGNSNTGVGLLTRSLHHSWVEASIGNCSASGVGFQNLFSVGLTARINVTAADLPFSVTSKALTAVDLDVRGAGEFCTTGHYEFRLEGSACQNGLTVNNAQYCEFTGFSEAQVAGTGVNLALGGTWNVFRNFDCEDNLVDFQLISSSRNTFLNCTAASATGLSISSSSHQNLFFEGQYSTVLVTSGCLRNRFISVGYINSFTAGDPSTRVEDVYNAVLTFLPDQQAPLVANTPTLVNSWVAEGGAYGPPRYYQAANGIVYLDGAVKSGTVGTNIFILPSGFRPVTGTQVFAVPNANDSTVVQVSVDTGGNVRHVTGTNTNVSLSQIRFLAN